MGVLLSVLVFPPPALRRPVLLAAWAANSVCETILRVTGLGATIKWPNDVLVGGRKVCGILIESKSVSEPSGDRAIAVMAGIGLNLNQTADSLVAAGLAHAGSLRAFTDKTYDCSATARHLIEELDKGYDRLCSGDLTSLEVEWRNRLSLLNQAVFVELADANYRGVLRSLNWRSVDIELADGERLGLQPEMVKHIRVQHPSA
jgi:BirA family biotin operon repressor/biotin-[acetyl-CoA-carboxylase] ligase